MDVLTHVFAPYAVASHFGRPRRERVAAAIGGLAPDLDTLWAWLAPMGEHTYPLTHRGFSHTLWGAPLLATLVWFLLTRPALKRSVRFQNFEWVPSTLTPLWLGAWSHVLLDSLTITGTPMFWPFDPLQRYTANWFFFGVPWFLPISLVALFRLFRRTASDRFVRRCFVSIGILFIVAGVLRFATLPDAPGSASRTPGPNEWEWVFSDSNDTGVVVTGHSWGRETAREFFPEPNRTLAQEAFAACQGRPSYTGWHWSLWGRPVVNATRTADAGWNLTFFDSALEFNRLHGSGPAFFRRSEPELATCRVTPDGVADFQRSRGWLGG